MKANSSEYREQLKHKFVVSYGVGKPGYTAVLDVMLDDVMKTLHQSNVEVLDRLEGEVNRTKPLFFTDEVPQSVEEVMELTVKIREEQRTEIKAIIERQKQELKEEAE